MKEYHFESEFFMVKTGIRSIELFGSLLFPFKEETMLDVPQADAGRGTPVKHQLRHDHGRVASMPTMDVVGKNPLRMFTTERATVIVRYFSV